MDTVFFADFVVDFDRDTDKHTCQQTTWDLNQSPLPCRLLFPDCAAFLQHRARDGGIRVAFEDAERIVHGIVPEGSGADEERVGNPVILTRPILYSDANVEDVIRAIRARRKHG